ncbi:fibronectin type III domain-containing protein [Spirosoma gilvum]
MKIVSTYLLSGWLLFLIACTPLYAQTPVPSASALCGITELTSEQALSLTKEANLALQKKKASGAVFTTITYVPIRPHIVQRSDGTGGFSLASLNQVIALTNSYFLTNGYGIQFYFAGDTPDYIKNDSLYIKGILYPDGNASNALNQYYVPFISSGAGGYAYYPSNDIISTRSVIAVGGFETEDDLGNRLIPHELGHNFNLIHTFGQNPGSGALGSGVTTELVTRGAGANCTTDGDLVCDTPADPYNMPGANLIYVNGCPQYDPTSTARDANGEAYLPSITNIMSYYFPCTSNFTAGQYDRMQAGLALRQTHTAYTLIAPPTTVTAPSNLTGTVSGTSIMLTWQDNATNEMGYFIERSTSPTTGFVPIGGVSPNVTTFTDTKAVFLTQYYYRIRPSNTTTGRLSPTVGILLNYQFVTTNITASSAQLNWGSVGNNSTYDLQWRAVGSSTWNTYSQLTTTNYTLSSLTANTAYEWQVKATTSATYYSPVSFTTTCPIPAGFGYYAYRSSAYINWNQYAGQTYTLQWRIKGNTNWSSLAGLSTVPYSLTGLNSSTPYEWRVQGFCPNPPAITTDFSSIQSFTTVSCQLPYGLYSTDTYATSARLSWSDAYTEPTKAYEIRYRPAGSPDWTTVSSLTASTYSLTGLAYNTPYEWQLKSICTPTESSSYSPTNSFTTVCRIPAYLSSYLTATTAQLSWSTSYPLEVGGSYELQYRPIGATDWITTNGLTTSYYLLTGLTTNITYEWRVRTKCSDVAQSDYSATSTFTPACKPPASYYTNLVSSTSAQLVWNGNGTLDAGTTFDLRYRPVGNPEWTMVNSLPMASSGNTMYTMTGLSNGVQYEWQIRSVCSATQSSTFTASQIFTTQCQTPYMWVNMQVTSATLNWYQTGLDVTYEVRYRQVGVNNWTTISNLTSTSVSITGLTANTPYEVQIRTVCSTGALYSSFSNSVYFYTASCTTPTNLYVTNRQATSSDLNWSFYYGNSDTRYEIRYRIVGSATWTTLSNLVSSSSYSYTTLTNLATDNQYEWQIRTRCSATESSAFSASSFFTLCSQLYTLQTGFWTDSSIWSCGRVPSSGDVVQLKHSVTLPTGYVATVQKAGFDPGGSLQYNNGAQLKIGY